MKTRALGISVMMLLGCSGSSGGDAGSDAALQLDCPTYCAGIATACTGDFAQYTNTASCMGACAAFPVGTTNDTGGNTLGCRLYHVTEIPVQGLEHCDHAGPAGQDECGSDCEGFCTVALHACTGPNMQYATMAACMTECAMFPDTEELNITVTSGNSLSCRLQHLTIAASNAAMATAECPNIRMNSTTCTGP